MSAHEQFGEDLPLYALGGLEGEEKAVLEKHLETCAGCREELAALRGDMAVLSTSVMGPKPPQRARQRLMEAIAKEPHGVSAPANASPRRARNVFGALGWLVAMAMFLVTFQLRTENAKLRSSVASLGGLIGQETTELENARRVVDTIKAPESQKFVLAAGDAKPQPQGKAFYLKEKSSLVFVANNLPQLPPEKIYELWLFPATGGPPIAAGLFKPDAQGSATVVNPPLPAGVEAKTFAVTLEPESGSHEAPRGTGVMRGIGL
jgi:anti-sigma-K factor RskA